MRHTVNGNALLVAAVLLFVVVAPLWRYAIPTGGAQASFETTVEADPFRIIAEMK